MSVVDLTLETSKYISLRKHPFLLALRRWGRFARNVQSGQERGQTDVFAGYKYMSTQNLKPAETASKWLEKRTDCGTDNTNKRLVIFIFEYFQKAESEFRT